MEVSGQFHTSAAPPPGKEPQCPLDRRNDGVDWIRVDWRRVKWLALVNVIMNLRVP